MFGKSGRLLVAATVLIAVTGVSQAEAAGGLSGKGCGSIIRLNGNGSDCMVRASVPGVIKIKPSDKSGMVSDIRKLPVESLPSVPVEVGSGDGNSLRVNCGKRVMLVSGSPGNVCR